MNQFSTSAFRFGGNQLGKNVTEMFHSDETSDKFNYKQAVQQTISATDIMLPIVLKQDSNFCDFGYVYQKDLVFLMDTRPLHLTDHRNTVFSFSPFMLNGFLEEKWIFFNSNPSEYKKATTFIREVKMGKCNMYGIMTNNKLDEKYPEYDPDWLMIEPSFVNILFKFFGCVTGEDMTLMDLDPTYSGQQYSSKDTSGFRDVFSHQPKTYDRKTHKESGGSISINESVAVHMTVPMRNCVDGYIWKNGHITVYFDQAIGSGGVKEGPVTIHFVCSKKYFYKPTLGRGYGGEIVQVTTNGEMVFDKRPGQQIGSVAELDTSKKWMDFERSDFDKYKRSEVLSINICV